MELHTQFKISVALLAISPMIGWGIGGLTTSNLPKNPPVVSKVEEAGVINTQLDEMNSRLDYQRARYQEYLGYLQAKDNFRKDIQSNGLPVQVADVAWDGMRGCGLDPWVIRDMWQLESKFDPKLVHTNKDGSQDFGLGQINERNIAWLTKLAEVDGNVFDPVQNAKMSIAALCHYKFYADKRGLEGDEYTHYLVTLYNKGAGGADNYYEEEGNNHYRSNYSVAVERIAVSRGGIFRGRIEKGGK